MKHTNEPMVPPGVLTIEQIETEAAELLRVERDEVLALYYYGTNCVLIETIPYDLRSDDEKIDVIDELNRRHLGKPVKLPTCQCCGGSGGEEE